MKAGAVLFDFDGTLVNLRMQPKFWETLSLREKIVKCYLENGVPATITSRYINPFELFITVYEATGIMTLEKFERIQKEASKILEEFELSMATNIDCVHESLEVLDWLKKKEMKIGVISINGERVIKKISKKTGIWEYVDVFFTRDSPRKPKPYADHIQDCMNVLGCKPPDTIMVGDTVNDLIAAKNAGIFFVGISNPKFLDEELIQMGADYIIYNLSDLTLLLKE